MKSLKLIADKNMELVEKIKNQLDENERKADEIKNLSFRLGYKYASLGYPLEVALKEFHKTVKPVTL